jgi:hypothetical protein
MANKVSFTSEYEFADFIEGYLQDLMSYIYALAKADENHNAIIQKFLNEVEELETKLSDAGGFEPGDDDAFANYMEIEADRQCFKEIIALLGVENFTNFKYYNTEVEYDGEVAKGPDFFAGISSAYVCTRYGYFYHDCGVENEVDCMIYDGCLFN